MNGTVGMESGLKLIRPSCGAIFVLRSPRSENASRDSNESTGFHIVLHICSFFAFLFFSPVKQYYSPEVTDQACDE